MIYLNLLGRAGNQMFQYAYAKKLSIESKQSILITNKYLFDKEGYENYLMEFKLSLNQNVIFSKTYVFPYYLNPNVLITKILKRFFKEKYWKFVERFNADINTSWFYKNVNFNFKKDIYLQGFFQSEQYFLNIKEELKRDFYPLNPLKNDDLLNLIMGTNSVCLSVRRGDYLSDKFKDEFFVCDKNYFLKAIQIIYEKVEKPVFIVFSDDICWAKKNLNFGDNFYFESGNDSISRKIQLMSSCKHFIISNSSFSWWSQYLSNNEEKIVIAPKRWFNGNGEASIYYNQNWIKI